MYAGMQDDETVVAGHRTSLFDWQPVDISAPEGILHYDASKNMRMPRAQEKCITVNMPPELVAA